MLTHLSDLDSTVTVSELLAELVPPDEFSKVSFDSYIPDPNFVSQGQAREMAAAFTKNIGKKAGSNLGIYLDGGFGVGKTHLLASIYFASGKKTAFGSFLAYTSIVGYLGFAEAVKQFSKYELLCIDEFELDDPGDTMIMSRFLKELAAKGVRFAATSNTPPAALGEGRFAADNFQREIQSVADKFQMVRIDGDDYRHRDSTFQFTALTEAEAIQFGQGEQTSLIVDFDELLTFLGSIHQSRYAKVAEQFQAVLIRNVRQINDQFEGIRLVSFIDRCYEAGVALSFTGDSLASLFREDHVQGAYRKKYLRALSRLAAMCSR
ncbi:MAG: cell division protein ZapE [Rhodoluna sp.]|nr:cell division protein ZapE [Rhodoluna sp.]